MSAQIKSQASKWESHATTDDPFWVLSMKQVVAVNIRTARERRGWSQADLADHLERCTNRKWTNVAVSAAEATWDAKNPRPRSFDIDDLMAFSLALRVPPMWFLLPPEDMPDHRPLDAAHTKFTYGRRREEQDLPALNQWQLLRLATELIDTNDPDDLVGPRLAQFDIAEPDVERGLNSLGTEQLRDLTSLLTKVINAAERGALKA